MRTETDRETFADMGVELGDIAEFRMASAPPPEPPPPGPPGPPGPPAPPPPSPKESGGD